MTYWIRLLKSSVKKMCQVILTISERGTLSVKISVSKDMKAEFFACWDSPRPLKNERRKSHAIYGKSRRNKRSSAYCPDL